MLQAGAPTELGRLLQRKVLPTLLEHPQVSPSTSFVQVLRLPPTAASLEASCFALSKPDPDKFLLFCIAKLGYNMVLLLLFWYFYPILGSTGTGRDGRQKPAL